MQRVVLIAVQDLILLSDHQLALHVQLAHTQVLLGQLHRLVVDNVSQARFLAPEHHLVKRLRPGRIRWLERLHLHYVD